MSERTGGVEAGFVHDQFARRFHRRFAVVNRIRPQHRRRMSETQRLVGHGFQFGPKRWENAVGMEGADKRNVALTHAVVVDGRNLEIYLPVVSVPPPVCLVKIHRHTLRHHQPLRGLFALYLPRPVVGSGKQHRTRFFIFDVAANFVGTTLRGQLFGRERDRFDLVHVQRKFVVVKSQVGAIVAHVTRLHLPRKHQRTPFADVNRFVGRQPENFERIADHKPIYPPYNQHLAFIIQVNRGVFGRIITAEKGVDLEIVEVFFLVVGQHIEDTFPAQAHLLCAFVAVQITLQHHAGQCPA